MPRAVAPVDLPAPTIDLAALGAIRRADDARAAAASSEPLDLDIRAVGREMRAYNQAAAGTDSRSMLEARNTLVKAVAKALTRSEDQLLALRAYQMTVFIAELRNWSRTGVESDELAALGGDFVATLQRIRWCRGDGRELVMDERVLRVLFKKRWNDLAGLRGERFDLTLDEDRVRFGFLLRHPFQRDAGTTSKAGMRRLALRRAQLRLKTIERLEQRDPSYPALLARGVVMYRTGRFPLAAEAFRSHLELNPDGPFTLRARNHLKASLDEANN